MSDPEISEVLRAWIVDELVILWHELEDAHRWTIGNNGLRRRNRDWSIRADSIANRIREASDLVGPVSWRNIGIPSLIDGWFKWANEKIGIVGYDYPTDNEQVENAALWRTHIAPTERVGFR